MTPNQVSGQKVDTQGWTTTKRTTTRSRWLMNHPPTFVTLVIHNLGKKKCFVEIKRTTSLSSRFWRRSAPGSPAAVILTSEDGADPPLSHACQLKSWTQWINLLKEEASLFEGSSVSLRLWHHSMHDSLTHMPNSPGEFSPRQIHQHDCSWVPLFSLPLDSLVWLDKAVDS